MSEHIKTAFDIWHNAHNDKQLLKDKWASVNWLKDQISKHMGDRSSEDCFIEETRGYEWVLSLLEENHAFEG